MKKGLPQGDASLAGAKYGIFKGEQLVDVYYTDENGFGQTKDMPYGIYTVHQTAGWDKLHGGFQVFSNFRGDPAFEINQNLKYWQPNNELEIGLMYSYIATREERFLERYCMVHKWVFAHFPDREHGEWYGYLNYDGTPLSTARGIIKKAAITPTAASMRSII